MSKHGQPMSQTLAQMHLNELKMNDPKLNKVFDKLKPKATVQLKTSSTIAKGDDFKTYLVVSKNTLRNGVEKITLKNRANPTGVKSFLYRRDGKVTFAIGDMGASIDDIKEKYSLINHEIIEEIEVEELDEDGHTDVASAKNQVKVAMSAMNKMNTELSKLNDEDSLPSWWTNKVAVAVDKLDGMADYLDTQVEEVELDEGKMKQFHMMQTDGKSAEEIAKALKLDLKTVKALMKEDFVLDEASARDDAMRAMGRGRKVDPADVDDTASDADKKSAMKNMIMQMRQSLDSKGSKPIEFEDGKKQKVDPKILTLLTKAHDKIQKPRDKEQFVKMISKSYRDMLKVSKQLSTLKMELDKEDEPIVKKVVDMLKKASQAHAGQADDLEKAVKEALELDEGFSPKEIKMAIGIASDPRYKGGNYTGAFKAIEKIKKGLGSHPQVAAVLKRQNENLEELDEGKKRYNTTSNVGKAKYVINFHDGKKTNKDGSDFFDIKIFKNKPDFENAEKELKSKGYVKEEVELEEKYDLYHKSFSDAMQHAYDYAKKKLGIIVDPKEIDNKVATGPKKPSEGKTNKYRLKGKGGNLQIQVYNKGGSKPFELNMYKEENDMTKSLKDTIVEVWSEAYGKVKANHYDVKVTVSDKDVAKVKKIISNFNGDIEDVDSDQVDGGGNKFKGTGDIFIQGDDAGKLGMEIAKAVRTVKVVGEGFASDAQRKAAFASGYKEKGKKKDKEEGNEFSGELNKARKAGKKTFKVGDKEYPVKPAKKESVERYHETKQGSLRDAVLQMWGEGLKKDEKKDLTKEKKDGSVKKMTDTGKEITPVETSVKMPKIKETKNKV